MSTSERQIRPLAKLKPAQQCEVWRQAVQEAGGKVPSSRVVKNVVDRIKEVKTDKTKRNISQHIKPKENTVVDLRTKKKEGINYEPGLGCEWYIRVEKTTFERIKDFQIRLGLATLDTAVNQLLDLAFDADRDD